MFTLGIVPDCLPTINAANCTNTYDVPGYDVIIDYAQPPDVPFSDADAAWVEAHLRKAGMRP